MPLRSPPRLRGGGARRCFNASAGRTGPGGMRKEVCMDRKKRRVTYMTGANATFGSYGLNDESK